MTINELKIQIESKSDLDFVMTNLKDHCISHLKRHPNFNITEPKLMSLYESVFQKIIKKIIDNIADNIQINGLDYYTVIQSEGEFEPLDESLIKKLTSVENLFESLLSKIIKTRETYPSLIENQVNESLKTNSSLLRNQIESEKSNISRKVKDLNAQLEKMIDGPSEEMSQKCLDLFSDDRSSIKSLSLFSISQNLENNCPNQLKSSVNLNYSNSLLTNLEKNLPHLVAKLDRAKTVLMEEGFKIDSLSSSDESANSLQSPMLLELYGKRDSLISSSDAERYLQTKKKIQQVSTFLNKLN